MNFFWSIFVYLLMAVVLGWGILLLIHGQPWVLITGALVYLFLLGKLGCLPKNSSSSHH